MRSEKAVRKRIHEMENLEDSECAMVNYLAAERARTIHKTLVWVLNEKEATEK